jgi:DnaA-homolog protein
MSRFVHPQQTALNLCLPDYATFDNFYIGQNDEQNVGENGEDATVVGDHSAGNRHLVHILHNVIGNPLARLIYLWGEKGCGRTHLLLACCAYYREQNLPVAYIPLRDLRQQAHGDGESPQQILENLEQMSLLCFDDVDGIAGDVQWEEALFHCFNRLQDHQNSIIVAANATPYALSLKLADLQSRLASGVISEVKALSDEQKVAALQFRAEKLGLNLAPATATFLLNHCARDSASLFALLKKLDHASLRAQRGLTIPFIKQALK